MYILISSFFSSYYTFSLCFSQTLSPVHLQTGLHAAIATSIYITFTWLVVAWNSSPIVSNPPHLYFLPRYLLCIIVYVVWFESSSMCIFVYFAKTKQYECMEKLTESKWIPQFMLMNVCWLCVTLCWCAMSLEHVSGTFCCLTQHICL